MNNQQKTIDELILELFKLYGNTETTEENIKLMKQCLENFFIDPWQK